MASLDGYCTCRQIRYQLLKTPLFVHCCHCRWCQRETGSSYALNAIIEASNVKVTSTAAPEIINTPSESGKGQSISRCPTCRVALWSNYGDAGDIFRFIRVGTLKEPDQLKPDIHIFTTSKQPWVVLGSDKPIVEEYYDRNQFWPNESLSRRETALKEAAKM